MKRVVLSIVFCAICWVVTAQRGEVLFRGRVTDAVTGDPLPLCHLYNLSKKETFYTDVSGYFSIRTGVEDAVQLSVIGYKTLVVKYVAGIELMEVKMEPVTTTLQSVVVRPGVNPAHRIIENAIRNRDKNNPEKHYSYQCMQYNRMTLHVVEDTLFQQVLARVPHPLFLPDTSSYNVVMESVVTRTFMVPENVEEKVIASKISGFKEYQQLAIAPSVLQFFHFYDDLIEWKSINQSYVNPISPNSMNRYFFLLQDTLISLRSDTTFVIAFQPSRLSHFDGLKGVLYINSNGWAIENVIAEPATATLFPIKIQQQYRLIDSTTWFPSELSFDASYNNVALTGLDMIYYSKSTISDVVINPGLGGRKVVAKTISIDPDAGKRLEYIERYRPAPLTQKELNTYDKYVRSNFDWVMQIAEGVIDRNSMSLSILDIPFNQILNYNYHEGWSFGVGLYTNWHLSPYFSVGGYWRYGLRDKRSKYGASISFFPSKDWDTEIKVWAQNDLAGLSYSREAGISGSALLGNFTIGSGFRVREYAPIFDYLFKGVGYDFENRLLNNELEIKMRYTVREQQTKIFRRTYSFRADYPVFYLKYAVGIPNLFANEYRYQRVELGVEFNRSFRNFGRTYLSLWGGMVSNQIPVMMLFIQSYLYRTLFFGEESKAKFNVIVNQTYAANKYINGFLYHDFGSLLHKTKSKIFSPRIAVAFSSGWSRLSTPEDHSGTLLQDMQEGYFENGVVIENILRLNYLNLFYFGLGGALYGAYGGSVEVPFVQTLTPMIRLSVSF